MTTLSVSSGATRTTLVLSVARVFFINGDELAYGFRSSYKRHDVEDTDIASTERRTTGWCSPMMTISTSPEATRAC